MWFHKWDRLSIAVAGLPPCPPGRLALLLQCRRTLPDQSDVAPIFTISSLLGTSTSRAKPAFGEFRDALGRLVQHLTPPRVLGGYPHRSAPTLF